MLPIDVIHLRLLKAVDYVVVVVVVVNVAVVALLVVPGVEVVLWLCCVVDEVVTIDLF